MSYRSAVILIFIVVLTGVGHASETDQALRTYLQDQLAETKAPSISVAVGVDGNVVLATAVGYSDSKRRIAATPQTQYRIYSITKAITAVAIMSLWQRQQIQLDDDIRTYVPEWPASHPPIQIANLLTHTSGIRHYKKDAGEISSRKEYDSLADAIDIFKDDPLEFAPGTGYRYTSFGYNLLQGVIESFSSTSFAAYLDSEVFGPAGMTQSALHTQDARLPDLAQPYYIGGWRKSLKLVKDLPNMSSRYAAGGCVSTPTDLVKLLSALENNILLKQETLEHMFSVPFPELNENQAFGWNYGTTDDGEPVLYRSGDGMGYGGLLMYYPNLGVSGALLVNVAEFEKRLEVLDHVLEPFLAAARAKP